MEVRQYLKIITVILFVLPFFYFLEKRDSPVQGIYLLSLDVIIEVCASIAVYRSRVIREKFGRLGKVFLVLFFLCLAWADFSWATAFYLLKLNSRQPIVVLNVAGGYGSAFLFGSLAIVTSLESSLINFLATPLTLFPLVITVPVSFRYLILPFLRSINGPLLTAFNFGELFAISTSFILLNLGLMTLLSSRNIFWSIFSAGMVSVIFGDWAMRVEKILGTIPSFGVYEFYWTFGIFISVSPILVFPNTVTKIEKFDPKSLLCNYKFWTAIVIFVSIVFVSISQYGNLSAIKLISVSCGIGAITAVFVGHLLVERVKYFSEHLAELVTQGFLGESQYGEKASKLPSELNDIFRLVFENKIEERKIRREQEISARLAKSKYEIASQVAHDIRSPLAALNVAEADFLNLPEETRVLVRSALGRIRDITSQLLGSNQLPNPEYSAESARTENVSPQLIAALIDGVIAEKRLQYRSKLGIEIEARVDPQEYGLFANIDPVEFKRMLSNLINNSIEAIGGPGEVIVSLIHFEKNLVKICVEDTGKGIPDNVIRRLGSRGQTYDKRGGSGLGLYHAIECCERWGGELNITSKVGVGTKITVQLPRANPPSWFVSRLRINVPSCIVIFDDDQSIPPAASISLTLSRWHSIGSHFHASRTPELAKIN